MHWTGADLGVGPEGDPGSPFCLGIFFFCKHVRMVRPALLLKYIFFNNIDNKKRICI